jgi:hypothetical protein
VPNRASLGLALAIMAVSGWGIYSALEWPLKAKLFPLAIGIPLFCLATAEALWAIFAKGRASEAADFKMSEDQPREVVVRRTLLAVAWALGFFAMIVLLGFQIAVPVLVFAYIRLQGKESWLFTIVFTAVVWALFYGLFDLVLHLPFPPGMLIAWPA